METDIKNQSKLESQNIDSEKEAAREAAQKARKLRREKAKKELPNYVRVGCDYYKLQHRPDKSGQTHKVFAKWSKSTIIDDYGKENLHLIRTFEGFTTVPSHTNFKQEIRGFYNEYSELSHKPQNGKFENIMSLINHVFGAENVEFALDYLQLLYRSPLQRLPIILLESKEKNTGKSTFGTLLKLMFEENAIKLGNSDLEDNFNAIWVKRLSIIVDETSLEKKGIMQMLKRYSTETSKVTANQKNISKEQIDFFGKFIFMSNDEAKALPIEVGEKRFAVFKVPTFKERGIKEIPRIEELLKEEIPHLIHFLLNRKLHHSEESRMYFNFLVYKTEQLKKYLKGSVSFYAQAIKELVNDTFDVFQKKNELSFSVSDILKELSNGNYAKNIVRTRLKEALAELEKEPQKQDRYERCSISQAEEFQDLTASIKTMSANTFYVFKRNEFL